MHSEKTTNLGLPIWQTHDHPDWLVDMNKAFKTLDASYGRLEDDSGMALQAIQTLQQGFQDMSTALGNVNDELTKFKEMYNSTFTRVNGTAVFNRFEWLPERDPDNFELPYTIVYGTGLVSFSIYNGAHFFLNPNSEHKTVYTFTERGEELEKLHNIIGGGNTAHGHNMTFIAIAGDSNTSSGVLHQIEFTVSDSNIQIRVEDKSVFPKNELWIKETTHLLCFFPTLFLEKYVME